MPSFPSLAECRSESGPSTFSHIGEDRIERMEEKILIVLGRTRTRTANKAKVPGNLQQVLASGRRLSYTPNIDHIVS